jgi:hypothetical protein
MENKMKKCGHCKELKPLESFCKNKRCKDGYHYTCKQCVNKSCSTEEYKTKRKLYYHTCEKYKLRKISQSTKVRKVEYDKIYRKKNADKIKIQKRDWEKLHKNDPIFKIKRNLRRRINHLVRGQKSDKTFNLIGCNAEEFKKHIESQFLEGMSWDNYGEWHIDHIVECFRFDLTDFENQKKCFHYTNQRPLWKKDNLTRKRI